MYSNVGFLSYQYAIATGWQIPPQLKLVLEWSIELLIYNINRIVNCGHGRYSHILMIIHSFIADKRRFYCKRRTIQVPLCGAAVNEPVNR